MGVGKKSRSQVARSRPIVYRRDGFECVVAGTFEAIRWPCSGGLTVQHRRGRGMGGSASHDSPRDLLAMCAGHNQLQTANAMFDVVCRWSGWSVPRWAADQYAMNRIPVKYADGWHLLDGDFRVTISASLAEDIMHEMYDEL